ncbi:GntR family transcriptional regulator [Companilactobacillus nodensis]|uniref:Transcriptional regulator n=1 Tax=Companilactobacillus nodensis DSM 19682 = JCM 14932 = NBRC 107160 TaxID=1423775 RepID=A0A0R1KHF9_9LACO|nr:GntR family transcriptional regulator [Companilactobacillus nodensis]KRK80388.1 transcriptional regulator [Companilactobacillus nodensis DSM 19682 = JCM 14932 = NBRC 107160]
MDDIIQVIKSNLDLTDSRPMRILIYEALRKTIILGDIPSGKRIVENKLSEKLNVSRTPIRYAFKRLAKEGLVTHKSGVGVYINGIHIRDAYEIFDIRKELDALATRKAMVNMDSLQYKEMEDLLHDTKVLNDEGKVREVINSFSQFDKFIYDASKMPRLKMIDLQLQEYLVYFRDVNLSSKSRRDSAIVEHRNIYNGMVDKNADEVNRLVSKHLDCSLKFVLKEMKLRNIS